MGRERHEAQAGAEREQGGDDGHSHRHDRAEGDQEHDDRGQQSDAGLAATRVALGALDGLAAGLDLEVRAGGAVGEVDDALRVGLRQVVRPHVEAHDRVGGAAVAGDRPSAGGDVRALHAGHVRHMGDLRQRRLHARPDRRVGHPPGGGAEDHLRLVPGLGAKGVLEEVVGALGVRAGKVEVRCVRRADRPGDAGDREERDDPSHEHEPPAAEAPGRE